MGGLSSLGVLDGAFSHELGDDLGTTTLVADKGKVFEHHIRPVLKKGCLLAKFRPSGELTVGDPRELEGIFRSGRFGDLKEYELGFLKALRYDHELLEVD
jgi:hypothetical protein